MPFGQQIFGRFDQRDMGYDLRAAFEPVNDPTPVVQQTVIDQSEVNNVSEIFGTQEALPPVQPSNPVLVNSEEVAPELANDIPVGPPVFFPTILSNVDAQPVEAFTADAQALPTENVAGIAAQSGLVAPVQTAVVQSVQTAFTNSVDRFSNVDLGLAALGGGAILITGAVALFRR